MYIWGLANLEKKIVVCNLLKLRKYRKSKAKSIKIGAIVGIVIVALAEIFLVSGKFVVTFDETSFTIKAAYWEDASVNYGVQLDRITLQKYGVQTRWMFVFYFREK